MPEDYTYKPLLRLSDNPKDFWTVDDATKGISIMGGTGSGKTSASGKKLANTFLKEGWGGLVLCAKTDEADLWRSYCRETGREDDLIIFGKKTVHLNGEHHGEEIVFNPIDYELKREGEGAGETQNITNIFMSIYRMGNRIASEGDTKEERYWDTALKRCLNRVIELVRLSGEDLTYRNMVKILASSNKLESLNYSDRLAAIERGDESLESLKPNDYCAYCLMQAYYNIQADDTPEEDINAYEMVEDYFVSVLKNMGDKTKSVVTESFMGLAEPFLSGLLRRHFSGATNIFPEITYTQNKIIVLDFPIKEFLDAGIIAQCVFKLLFQQAIERRDIKKYPNPVFLWCDEAHYFINPYDQIFLTTARSSRAVTVYLSQNISNYLAVMGSGSDAKARVDSLMGNLSTKIFHANSDAETNEYASRLIGSDLMLLSNVSTQQGYTELGFSTTEGLSSQFLPQVQPRKFTILKTGGKGHDNKVQAIILVSGREWSDGKNYFNVTFTQNFNT
jgi:hypothetical protein